MKQVNDIIYVADEGNFLVSKKDGSLIGTSITLGDIDSIFNYYERPYTEEEYRELYGDADELV